MEEHWRAGKVKGCVCLGYPFHPLGKPLQQRTEHLEVMQAPLLVVQGERDSMGCHDEVITYPLSSQLTLSWIPDGNHSFTPRKDPAERAIDWSLAVERVDAFLRFQLQSP